MLAFRWAPQHARSKNFIEKTLTDLTQGTRCFYYFIKT